ncbi:Fe-S cluster assembly protein SufD [Rhodoflexus caldus]|uniref:Fe-S cluster assembly protein SufD n=1 Tax=Rhodoflexus caldus TaxID=2891236 RepID=UPI002029EB5B|nr:Fe-S cluster assembly protein SufD [Rhodoflexus caldus]
MEKTDLKSLALAYLESKPPQSDIQKHAAEVFRSLDIPTTKNEEWKYLNLKNIASRAYTFANGNASDTAAAIAKPFVEAYDEQNANVLVFVNGVYMPALSRVVSPESDLKISNLREAKSKYAAEFGKYFGKYANDEHHIFAALNTAADAEGAFIYVPNNKTVEAPVILHYIASAEAGDVLVQTRNLFVVGTSAQLTVVEHYNSTEQANHSLTNMVTEVFVGGNARFDHYKIQNEANTSSHIGFTQTWQLQDSHYANTTVSLSGEIVRNNLHIAIDGQNCEAFMNGLYVLDGNTVVDNHTVADHRQPHSHSNELYKGLLDGKSQAVFNGKIFVRQDAQKTNAFQSNKNILLSPNANVDTKPQLEIWADDVKCSHGCTVGALDEEPLFYLRARGINEENARALLMFAFAEDVLERIQVESVRRHVEKIIAARLKMDI